MGGEQKKHTCLSCLHLFTTTPLQPLSKLWCSQPVASCQPEMQCDCLKQPIDFVSNWHMLCFWRPRLSKVSRFVMSPGWDSVWFASGRTWSDMVWLGDEWSGLLIGLLFWSCGWTLWQAQIIKLMTACYSLHSNIHNPLSFELMGFNREPENPQRIFNVAQTCIKMSYILFASQCFKRDCQIFQPKPRKSAPERPTQECCLQYKQSCCGPGKCLASACRTQRTKKWINHKSKISKRCAFAGDIQFVLLVGHPKASWGQVSTQIPGSNFFCKGWSQWQGWITTIYIELLLVSTGTTLYQVWPPYVTSEVFRCTSSSRWM